MFRLLDRYIASEILLYYLGVYLVTVFLLTANDFFLMLDKFVQNSVPWPVALQMTYLKMFFYLPIMIPPAVLFSTVLGVGRMAHDNEIAAFRTSGISVFRLMRSALVIGALSALAAWHLNESVVPSRLKKFADLYARYIGARTLGTIKARVFLEAPDGRIFYFGRVDKQEQRLYDIMVVTLGYGARPSQVLFAQEGSYEGEIIRLKKGILLNFDYRGRVTETVEFEENQLDARTIIEENLEITYSPSIMSLTELELQIQEVRAKKDRSRRAATFLTEYHFRYAFPLTSLVFAVITFALATRASRGARYLMFIYSIVLFGAYYGLVTGGKVVGYLGVVPPWVAGWSTVILFGLLALVLGVRAEW